MNLKKRKAFVRKIDTKTDNYSTVIKTIKAFLTKPFTAAVEGKNVLKNGLPRMAGGYKGNLQNRTEIRKDKMQNFHLTNVHFKLLTDIEKTPRKAYLPLSVSYTLPLRFNPRIRWDCFSAISRNLHTSHECRAQLPIPVLFWQGLRPHSRPQYHPPVWV